MPAGWSESPQLYRRVVKPYCASCHMTPTSRNDFASYQNHCGERVVSDAPASGRIPAGMSANALATALHVPAPRINDIVRERRGVSADTAMRWHVFFGGDARSWLNLQAAYDLRVAEIANAKKVEREVQPSDLPAAGG